MQLTKLEIKGFKSFGDKVSINFDEGITGIVGPNGCGKSNVVDAIRWVLGEQKTRALRSDKMENVIFNGTKTRKPTQLAEVSLTFSNTKNLLPTEYSQVTITRRYYRSGDSEYLLNGITCRLKDITNLFLDTGIASNSYAIIELKMVDDILNDKDNSRRGLFEEAAGISKFKIRKKETLRKLEDTAADLDRVEDLLFEIAKNLKSLEKQARQAKRYYELKEEYKNFSIAWAKKNLTQYRDKFIHLNKQLQQEQDQKLSLTKQVNENDAVLEALKADLINKEKLLASRQKTLNDYVNTIRQYESENKIKNERLRFLNDKRDSLRQQLSIDKQAAEEAKLSIQNIHEHYEAAKQEHQLLQTNLSLLKENYEAQKAKTDSLQAEVNALNQNFKDQQRQSFEANKALEIKQMQLSGLKQELEKATGDSQNQASSLQVFEDKLLDITDYKTEKEEALTLLKKQETQLKEDVGTMSKAIEQLKELKTDKSRVLDQKQNEYSLTKSLVDNLEGFPEAIKFLKKHAGWGKHAPLLSDIITCPEAYRVAIENYLEQYMNFYVLHSRKQALEAVNLLQQAAKGRANFFMLDSIPAWGDTIAKRTDAIAALDIVEFDAQYATLIHFLLKDVYITEKDPAEITSDGLTYISKSGTVIQRPHSIAGGSVGLFEGKRIGRAKNLINLEQDIKSLQSAIADLEGALSQKQQQFGALNASTAQNEIEALQIELNEINQEFVSIRSKKEQFAEMLESNANKKEDIIDRIDALQDEISELSPQAAAFSEKIGEDESRLHELQVSLSSNQQLLSEKSSLYNEENIRSHQFQNKMDQLSQELSYKQNALLTSEDRIANHQEETEKNEYEIDALLAHSENSEDALIGMYAEKENIEKAVNEAEKEYYTHRGQIDETDKATRDFQRKKEQVDTIIMEFQSELNETKLKMNGIQDRLSVEFNLDIDLLMTQNNEQQEEELMAAYSEQELKEKVNETKSKLDKIGPINPMAMEAYDEIKERNDFISSQKEDLLNAKESLLSTIDEIDTVAKATFLEAYHKIKENFIKVFRSLFTEEDDCDLKLSDPDNPLESSIEIMAKPKGKRPLTINQLSGGEKTLTATSLLFAIYLLKPAPFCIFDEVDAPLDDANIDKFNNIIKEFSKDSQFIIVTHNKRTMASTDVVYGITMIEQGVSRVVPVDLRALV